MKCPKCFSDMMELWLTNYDFNVDEETMFITVLMECEECDHQENYEISGSIKEIN